VAGARSSLLSLWKVDEGHARSFLERYYSLLKAGKGRADALLQTPKGISRQQKLQLQRHPGVGRFPAQRRLASPARVVRQPKAR
jgi:CHAT domain-containing protein